jgi:myosin-5
VYAIADHAYRQMMGEERKSQAVLISGESGAGKTESTKIVMLYLTTLGAGGSINTGGTVGELSIMERVLQSNPVLEAFGNARTLRNDNSSRFGKFIELGFSRAGHLMGAKVQTYLLEKVRVAFHASGERNFHMFYQILRGASEEQKKLWEFHEGLTQGLELPNYFHYTGQGGAPHLREFTDEDGLKYTMKAMQGLGWDDATINEILSMIAGILHLGQLQFESEEVDGVDASVVTDKKGLAIAAKLMGVDVDMLETALTERLIFARGQEIRTKLTPERSSDARDALGKTLYGAIFLWVVAQVNKSIGWANDNDIRSSTGVLDIFGFECFAVNSFEQLCINFTNEALQQQFNKFIFKLEQEEYEREHISWAFIEFPDNQDCLDTIQIKKTGVLAMLDDECRLPGGNDRNYAKRMYEYYLPNKNQTVSENTRFHAEPVQKSKSIFCIRHFAGLVAYSAETSFMEKNKDEIPLTAQTMFETAPSVLVKDVYAVQKAETEENTDKAAAGAGGQGKAKSKTVGQQFKQQLASLIENVEKTDPHYIRCLKPNDSAKPLVLVRKRLTEQLRYGGVLEAVRVARMGYPVRLPQAIFFQRYRLILPTVNESILPWNLEEGDPQKLCVKLVDCILEHGAKQIELTKTAGGALDPHEDGITRSEKVRRMQRQVKPIDFPKTDVQLGSTKVFMRKPPHDALEAHRGFHQHASATILQSWMRGMREMRKYLITADAALTVQRVYRGHKGRERWTKLRKEVASQLLTNNLRMQLVRRRFNLKKRGTIQLQGIARGRATRKLRAAIKVQTFARMLKLRTIYTKIKSAVLALQCKLRVCIACAELGELKKEQKDVGKLKQNNEKLKTEMASLKAMLTAQAQSAASSNKSSQDMLKKKQEIELLERRIKKLEVELEREKELVKGLEDKLVKQKDAFEKEKTHMQQSHSHELSRVATAAVRSSAPASPRSPRLARESPKLGTTRKIDSIDESLMMPNMPSNYVSPEVVAQHKAMVTMLENELESERKLRLEADGEIIQLRANLNGVQLGASEVQEILAKQSPVVVSRKMEAPVAIEEGNESYDEDESGEDENQATRYVHDSLFRFGQNSSRFESSSCRLCAMLNLLPHIAPQVLASFALDVVYHYWLRAYFDETPFDCASCFRCIETNANIWRSPPV